MTHPDPTPGQPAYARGIRDAIETGTRPCGHADLCPACTTRP